MEGAWGRECQTLHSPPGPAPWCTCFHLDSATTPAHHLSGQAKTQPCPPCILCTCKSPPFGKLLPILQLLGATAKQGSRLGLAMTSPARPTQTQLPAPLPGALKAQRVTHSPGRSGSERGWQGGQRWEGSA